MPPGRTFSFEHDDERQLSYNEQEQSEHQPPPRPYHDLPARHIISPPPQYSSPPPREPVSPISPASSFGRNHSNYYADGPARRRSRSLEYSQSHAPRLADDIPPLPPPHRHRLSHDDRRQPAGAGPIPSLVTLSPTSPASDNFGTRAEGGGLDHLAVNMTDRHQRQSGIEALRGMEGGRQPQSHFVPERGPTPGSTSESSMPPNPAGRLPSRHSYSSNIPLAAGAATPGSTTPGASPDPRSSRYSGRSIRMDEYPAGYASYHDSPYQTSSLGYNPAVSEASIDPYNIADDGDDGFIPDPKRRSMLNLSRQSSKRGTERSAETAGAVGPAAAAGGLFARKQKNVVPSNGYDPVRQPGDTGNGAMTPAEKTDWLSRQSKGNKRMGWTVGLVIGAVVILAMIGGIVGGVLGTRTSSSSGGSSGSTNNAAGDTAANGDLNLDSPEIQGLMNNKNLHKVFPGLDYTPWGTQYPLCLTYPPSQNNVTRDMAVVSQLTNAVRLYGTDCNQTEMVLHAIDRLKLTNMKVWLGVWIDQTNQTTNDRQLAQMYNILANTRDRSIFKGAIIGNEALFHASASATDKADSETALINTLTEVKANFTSLGYKIPVATSDLGDNWNGQLVDAVDIVMSNIHPFFAGVNASVGAAWTLDFWNTHDQTLTATGSGNAGKQQIIAETGWPSGGGTDCGGSTGSCGPGQPGAVASIDDMNTFMDSWVCQALANGTEYFWFEAFDEPWKIIYDTPTQQWEDKWGLMDQARNLKTGLSIPDCGGKTVS